MMRENNESTIGQTSSKIDKVLSSKWYQLILKLQSTISYCTYDFFRKKLFDAAMLPVTTGSITSPMGLGSDSQPVKINLFNSSTYLADSMQFHLEYLLRISDKGVFYIMPTFRGEDPDFRHLNQFSHIEAEIKGGLNTVTDLIDEYLIYLVEQIVYQHGDDILQITGDIKHLEHITVNKKDAISRISFSEALNKLGKDNISCFSYYEGEIIGLSNEGEKKLSDQLEGIVCLTHLPKIGVPFYQADANDNTHTLCADYLAGIGEFLGCGERHISYQATLDALKEREVQPDKYDWYLEIKNKYPMQTSGFGLGVERFLLWLLKYEDIRDIPLISRLKGFPCNP